MTDSRSVPTDPKRPAKQMDTEKVDADQACQLRLLGPFRATVDNGEPKLRRKTRALVAYLATTMRSHTRQALCDLFFVESQDPLRALRWQLSQIRRQLGSELLLVENDEVALAAAEVALDVDAFRRVLDGGLSEQPLDLLCCAVALYEGEFLENLSLPDSPEFELWLLAERARYRNLYVRGLDEVGRRLRDLGEYERAISYVQKRLQIDPLVEETHKQLIWLFGQTEQRSAALAQFEQCRSILQHELNVTPSPELIALHADIVGGRLVRKDPTVPAESTPITPARQARPQNIPARTTPFWGRTTELADLEQIITEHSYRLITLVGPGGVGKTRLALHLAAQQAKAEDGRFADGVYFVPFAAISSEDGLIAAIADVLDCTLSGAKAPVEQLSDALKTQSVLLVLDNFEHLVDHSALLSTLLEAAAQLVILVTSRNVLNLYEERTFALDGLDVPREIEATQFEGQQLENFSAIRHFGERAQRADTRFEIATEIQDVVRICQLLHGMPLAIELAAGWVRTYSCGEILGAIEQNMDFLSTRLRNVPERHRSLRAAFDHSWHLLSETEQILFARLSVFRGGFDLSAAEHVAGVSHATLQTLLDTSMVQRMETNRDIVRYQIHEQLRQFAAEQRRSMDEAQIERFHSSYFAQFVYRQEQEILAARQDQALDEIRSEFENILAGWHYTLDQIDRNEAIPANVHAVIYYAPMLSRFFRVRGRSHEGVTLFSSASVSISTFINRLEGTLDGDGPEGDASEGQFSLLADSKRALATIHISEARTRYALGQFTENVKILEHSIEYLRQHPVPYRLADAHINLALSQIRLGNYAAAEKQLEEGLRIARELEDDSLIVNSTTVLGMLAHNQERLDDAEAYFEASANIFRTTGYGPGLSNMLMNLAVNHRQRGQFQQALALYHEAYDLVQEDENLLMHGILLCGLGGVSFELQMVEQALDYYAQSLALFRMLNDQRWTAESLNGQAQTLLALAQTEQAESLVGEALQISLALSSIADALTSLQIFGKLQVQKEDWSLAFLLFCFVEQHEVATPSEERQHLLKRCRSELAVDEIEKICRQSKQLALEEAAALILEEETLDPRPLQTSTSSPA